MGPGPRAAARWWVKVGRREPWEFGAKVETCVQKHFADEAAEGAKARPRAQSVISDSVEPRTTHHPSLGLTPVAKAERLRIVTFI